MSEKVTFTTTERGFRHLAPLTAKYGGVVSVYESSNAMVPCVWLEVAQPESDQENGVAVQLTLKDLRRLRAQLKWIDENHYHRSPLP